MNKTKIEYADFTWNPITGCTMGCSYCYARRMTERFKKIWGYDFTPRMHWKRLEEPLRVKKPARIFVCDMGDLFDPQGDTLLWLSNVLYTVQQCSRHTFLFLTKRPLRMKESLERIRFVPPNTYWGTSVTTQAEADKNIPILLQVPGKHWISVEPLLESVDISPYLDGIDWVICGGESGPGARLMNLDWARDLRNQCKAAGIPYFLKQLGGHPDKRNDMSKWPDDLRIREYPEVK